MPPSTYPRGPEPAYSLRIQLRKGDGLHIYIPRRLLVEAGVTSQTDQPTLEITRRVMTRRRAIMLQFLVVDTPKQ